MSAVLKSPWQGLGRQVSPAGGARQVQIAGSTEALHTPKTQVRGMLECVWWPGLIVLQSRSPSVLPEFLYSVTVSALHQIPSAGALKSIPTVSGTISAGQLQIGGRIQSN